MGPGEPFPEHYHEEDIDSAQLVCQLRRSFHSYPRKSGCETWTCAWSPDEHLFAWSCGNRIVKLVPWNRYKCTTISQDGLDEDGHRVDDGSLKSLVIDAGELVWSVAIGSPRQTTAPNTTQLNWYRYSSRTVSDGLILATGLNQGRIRTWSVKTGQLFMELSDHSDVIRNLKFAPDGSLRLLSASRDGTLKLWDLLDDGNMSRTLTSNSKWVYACCWSPSAKLMVSVGDSRSALIWSMETYRRLWRLEGHHHDVVGCDFSPDGALLVTASYDTQAIIWDPFTGEKLQTLKHQFPTPSPIFAGGANGSYLRDVSFSHDGVHVVTICDDRYLRFWNIHGSSTIPEQIDMIDNALCCSYSPDGAVVAVGTREGNVGFWLSPMKVSSLRFLCLTAIRRVLPTHGIDSLALPSKVRSFLKYEMLRDI